MINDLRSANQRKSLVGEQGKFNLEEFVRQISELSGVEHRLIYMILNAEARYFVSKGYIKCFRQGINHPNQIAA